jgi:hypothetical protein
VEFQKKIEKSKRATKGKIIMDVLLRAIDINNGSKSGGGDKNNKKDSKKNKKKKGEGVKEVISGQQQQPTSTRLNIKDIILSSTNSLNAKKRKSNSIAKESSTSKKVKKLARFVHSSTDIELNQTRNPLHERHLTPAQLKELQERTEGGVKVKTGPYSPAEDELLKFVCDQFLTTNNLQNSTTAAEIMKKKRSDQKTGLIQALCKSHSCFSYASI